MLKIFALALVIIPPIWLLLVVIVDHYNPVETNDDWDN